MWARQGRLSCRKRYAEEIWETRTLFLDQIPHGKCVLFPQSRYPTVQLRRGIGQEGEGLRRLGVRLGERAVPSWTLMVRVGCVNALCYPGEGL